MKNILAISATVFCLCDCSLATPDKTNCDACLDGGHDTVRRDTKPNVLSDAKPDMKISDARPDEKKTDLFVATYVDNDKDGYYSDVDCNDNDPSIHPNAKEICDGKDNDCDGQIDNNLTDTGKLCGSSVGECRQGTLECINSKLVCDGATLVLPKNEICDGKDNDCDGKADEDYPDLGKVCEVGAGECKRSGHLVCNGSATILKCDAVPAKPVIEGPPGDATCYDGKDNNCNGLTDADEPDCKECDSDADCSTGNKCSFDKCVNRKCEHKPLSDGVNCDDGLFCNGISRCQGGGCVSGPKPTCDDSNQCTADFCDEIKHCVNTPIIISSKEGSPGSSACRDGQDNDCDGFTDLADSDCRECDNDLQCAKDANPCMNYSCNTSRICVSSPKIDGMLCNDGSACNGMETCQAGKCQPGVPVKCEDNNVCTIDGCDESLQGKCVYTAVQGCKSCAAASDCNDGNDCTADACTAGKCYNTVKADNTACEDGAFCTVNKKCLGGACVGTPRDCSAFADKCNDFECDEQYDVCKKKPKANGTACDNGLYCDGYESCWGGACQSGTPAVCNDNDSCTQDICDAILDKCVFNLKNLSGSESWTIAGTCSDGADNDCDGKVDYADSNCRQCQTNGDCNDGNVCTQDVCNLATYKCENNYLNGISCDDGKWCTVNDACSYGVCNGTLRDCSSYGDICNVGTCDESADTCKKSPKPDSTICDDGQWCTVSDHCSSGTCISGGLRNCGTGYTCNEVTDQCGYQQCQNNSDCNDNNPCTQDVCDTTTWTCGHQNANGTPCDDGQWCTIGEYCVNGYCANGQPKNCSPGTCNEYYDKCDNQTNGPGCADSTREGFVDGNTFPNIAGCSGTWSNPGLTNANYLCASGWHICNGASDVSSRLPFGKTCADAWSGSEKRFFATYQSSGGFGYCNTPGTNDIFGCGNYGDPPAPSGSCSPLNVFSSEDCGAIKYPYSGAPETWRCGNTSVDSSDELTTVVKLQMIGGGVLCCKN